MKTAMQELIIGLNIDDSNSDIIMEKSGIRNSIIFAHSLLETEKQQIIKAYDDAFQYVVGGGFVAKTGEQYFEEVYGTTNK